MTTSFSARYDRECEEDEEYERKHQEAVAKSSRRWLPRVERWLSEMKEVVAMVKFFVGMAFWLIFKG